MSRARLTHRALAAAAFMLALAPLAHGQATRTWVSGVGDDANPCSRTAPCKTFAGAISKTATGGEISVLDPGGYGAVTIGKSLTIDGGTGSGWASILASGFTGIIINATDTSVVTLRNISINGAGTTPGTNGIRILNAGKVFIENCQIFGFTTAPARGISDERTVAIAGTKRLNVKDTVVRNNGTGIVLDMTTQYIWGTLENVQAVGNTGAGILVDGAHVRISNSNASANGGSGISVAQSGPQSYVVLDTVGAQGNAASGVAVTGGTVVLTNSVITDNSTAGISGNAVSSFQNNKINGNGGGLAGNDLPVGSTNLAVK